MEKKEEPKINPAAKYETCTEGHEMFWEALYQVDIYKNKPEYYCERCKQTKSIHEAIGWHCRGCKYIVCNLCKPLEERVDVCPKNHPLVKMTSKVVMDEYKKKSPFASGWSCDKCRKHFTETSAEFDWHCSICGFDLCSYCRPD